MKIYIFGDHRGFELKKHLIEWLKNKGYTVEDFGNTRHEPLDDYVDFAFPAMKSLQEELHQNPESNSIGIGVCGSGIGVAIAANRFKGIRAGHSDTIDHVTHGRENDHTNVLALSADTLTVEKAEKLIDAFITAKPKPDEKYERRANKLDQI